MQPEDTAKDDEPPDQEISQGEYDQTFASWYKQNKCANKHVTDSDIGRRLRQAIAVTDYYIRHLRIDINDPNDVEELTSVLADQKWIDASIMRQHFV